MHNALRIYIVYPKNCEFVETRGKADVCVEEMHYTSPKIAWETRVRSASVVLRPSEHVVVGCVLTGENNERGVPIVDVDWSDMHEASSL